ncbi:MAG: polysaccharide deacetylase family protein, partial [Prevotella sp.]|nr:polysaccharide deacetylase family protein [Prevotella sp.]
TRILTTMLAMLTMAVQAQETEIATWQGFRKGAASFTFDQGAPSHVSDAGPLFDKYGYKGTFYLVYNWNPNWSGFGNMAKNGHEIGSNSDSHPNDMTNEIASSKNHIAGTINQKYGVITVAYPNCNIPSGETTVLQNYIAGRICNGSWVGLDNIMGKDGPDKWSRVPALMTGAEAGINSTSAFTDKMREAIGKNGWVVFLTHGFQGKNNGNANYSPTDINAIDGALRWAQQNDKDIWIAPLGHVAMYIKERNASTFELKGSDTRTRTYSLTHNIADNVSSYDYPLSVRIPLPEGWSDIEEVRQNGAKLEHKIDGGYVYFDAVPNAGDIVVKRQFSLVELQDNGEGNLMTILANNNLGCHVKINGRTLYRDGRWNTIYLPFGLDSLNGTPLEGADVRALNDASFSNGTLTLNWSQSLSAIEAGTPYIVRWNPKQESNISNPVFDEVTLSNASDSVKIENLLRFFGSNSALPISGGDRVTLYLGGDNKFYYPENDMTIGAFRAIFTLYGGYYAGDPQTGSEAKYIGNFVMNFDGETTGLTAVDSGQTVDSWYSIDGRKLSGEPTAKGIYIRNGKKVVK